MRTVSWSDLRKEGIGNIVEGECLKVTADGEMALIIFTRPEGEMINRLTSIASMVDASKPAKVEPKLEMAG